MTDDTRIHALLHLIAALLDGALLEGWTGPAQYSEKRPNWYGDGDEWTQPEWRDGPVWDGCQMVDGDGEPGMFAGGPDTITRLPLARAEVRDRVIRVLGEGVRCEGCDQCLPGRGVVLHANCPGTGYSRPPHDLDRFRDRPGGLTPLQSAAVLGASLLRVSAGMGPVVGLLNAWVNERSEWWHRRSRIGGYAFAGASKSNYTRPDAGWWCDVGGSAHGPETGDEGKAAADAAAFAAGYALLDSGGIWVPTDTTPIRVPADALETT